MFLTGLHKRVLAAAVLITGISSAGWLAVRASAVGAGSGTIGDLVWSDSDGDGRQDPGEPGVAGVTVEIWAVPENTLASTVSTTADGRYTAGGLATERCYRVRVRIPAGMTATLTDQGSDDLDSDINAAGVMQRWACPGWGTPTRQTYDAGLLGTPVVPTTTTTTAATTTTAPTTTTTTRPATGVAVIEGAAYEDRNRNGRLDVGEPPVSGLGIALIWGQCLATSTRCPAEDDAAPYDDVTRQPSLTAPWLASQLEARTGTDGTFRIEIDLADRPAGYSCEMFGAMVSDNATWHPTFATADNPIRGSDISFPAQNGAAATFMPCLTPGSTWRAGPVGWTTTP